MGGLTELAELLLENEVIFSEDLERIFGKRKADQLKEAREAEAKAINGTKEDKKESLKEGKNRKKSDKLLNGNSKTGSKNSDIDPEVGSAKKVIKKSDTKNIA